ncbi:hypothetical protein V8C34DRAFT_242748 [Trichoderma compactum]
MASKQWRGGAENSKEHRGRVPTLWEGKYIHSDLSDSHIPYEQHLDVAANMHHNGLLGRTTDATEKNDGSLPSERRRIRGKESSSGHIVRPSTRQRAFTFLFTKYAQPLLCTDYISSVTCMIFRLLIKLIQFSEQLAASAAILDLRRHDAYGHNNSFPRGFIVLLNRGNASIRVLIHLSNPLQSVLHTYVKSHSRLCLSLTPTKPPKLSCHTVNGYIKISFDGQQLISALYNVTAIAHSRGPHLLLTGVYSPQWGSLPRHIEHSSGLLQPADLQLSDNIG